MLDLISCFCMSPLSPCLFSFTDHQSDRQVREKEQDGYRRLCHEHSGIMNEVQEYFNPQNWSLLRLDDNTEQLYFSIYKGSEAAKVKKATLKLGEGIAGTVAYVILAPVIINKGYPSILGILIAALVVILPIELGILFAAAKKKSGTFSITTLLFKSFIQLVLATFPHRSHLARVQPGRLI